MADGRDVTLRLKAENQTGPALAQAKAALEKFGAASKKAVVTRDSYGKAAAEVRQLEAAFNRASADASRYAQAMDKAARAESLTAAEARELRDAFVVARQRMRDLNTEVRAAKSNLNSLGGSTAGVRSSFARISSGWSATANAAREAAREAQRAAAVQVAAARRAADAQGRAAVKAIRANRARKASFLSLFGVFQGGAHNKASKFLSGEAAAGTARGRGFLGLRPYELTNLSYQINDVVTGLASGQKPLQVLAQQGGQVFQLFQSKLLPIIGRFGPVLLAAGIAATPLIAALRRISTESDNLAAFNSQIERTGSGAAYSSESLVALAQELSRTGLSAEEARGAISAFIDAGIAQDRFRQMALAAKNLADALGIDVYDAAEQMATAFGNGFDAVLEFDGLMKRVPTSVLATAIAMAESGDEAGALNLILAEVAGTGGDLADDAAGPWTEAFQSVATAWNTFIDALANSATIQGAINLVSTLSGVVAGLVGGLANLITKLGGVAGALQADNGLLGQAIGIGKNAIQAAIPGSGVLSRFAPGGTFGPDKPAEAEIIGDNPNGDIFDPTAGGTAANADLIDGYNQRRDALEELAEAEQEAADEASKAILDRIEAQQDFNAELAETIQQNEFERSQIGKSAGEQAYRNAVREAENKAKREGIAVDEEALRLVGESARATAEAAEAEKERNKAAGGGAKKQKEVNTELERRKELEKEVADLTRLRSELEESISTAEDNGDTEAATALRDRMAEVNTELTAAIDNMIAFWTATGGAEAEAAILKLERLKTEVANTGEESVTTGKAMNDFIAGGGADAFDKFSKAVVETGNVFESARIAFLEFASDFLREIAQMILRQAILNALGGGSGGNGGGGGGIIAGLVNGLFRHQGGLVGSGGGMRPVPMAAFAGAARFHEGGLPGLKPGEVAAVLQKGEEVLTADDPRHVGNGGGAAGGGNTRIVNAFDGASFLEEAMRSRSGEKVILNFIRSNPSAVRGALGV